MTTHPMLPIFVDAWGDAVAHLSVAEEGVYFRLIRLAWQTPGCSLPSDPKWLARKLRLSSDEFDALAKPVIAEFFSASRGRLSQKRLSKEFDFVTQRRAKHSEDGKKGVVSKALKKAGLTSSQAQASLPIEVSKEDKVSSEPLTDRSETHRPFLLVDNTQKIDSTVPRENVTSEVPRWTAEDLA